MSRTDDAVAAGIGGRVIPDSPSADGERAVAPDRPRACKTGRSPCIADLLTPDRVVLDVKLRDKAYLISESARLCGALAPGVAPESVEAALTAREDLGSTGLGGGFALPHARIDGLRDYAGLFLRLARPIDFAAIDGKPVDLAFVLLIPFDTKTPHVSVLAAIARRARDTTVAAGLRTAKAPALVFDLLTGVTKS